MMKVGITGQSGFIGTHLFNYLGLQDGIERIPFQDSCFDSDEALHDFVKECDAIVHLAAVNRHEDEKVLYQTNIDLVKKLINALDTSRSKPHLIFASSTQEELGNLYGESKRIGRELLAQWAGRNHARFSGMVIPNVFGPFGRPYYNSVVATFCHQLTHGEEPRIVKDRNLKLIYSKELVDCIFRVLLNASSSDVLPVAPTGEHSVSEILEILRDFRQTYLESGVFPDLQKPFVRDLFNTFMCSIPRKDHFPVTLQKHEDARGMFVETMKLKSGGQVSFSTTVPEVTRGNHFHIRKVERFAVIKGEAVIRLRRIGTDAVETYRISGDSLGYVDIPIWHTHNISNIGGNELVTLFWINEHFNKSDPDTYYEKV